jgi:uncharacterized protein (DUF2141 family)
MFRMLLLSSIILVPNLASLPAQNQTPTQTASKATLTVTVGNLHSTAGQVFVQLWDTADGFPKAAGKAMKYDVIDGAKIVDGKATATFPNLEPGTYAVSTLHDENKNGKMDNNMFGLPKEGWAVSNNVVTHTHPPSFAQASIQVHPGVQQITIDIHY